MALISDKAILSLFGDYLTKNNQNSSDFLSNILWKLGYLSAELNSHFLNQNKTADNPT